MSTPALPKSNLRQVTFRYIAKPLGRTTLTVPIDANFNTALPSSHGWSCYFTHLDPELNPTAATRKVEVASVKTGTPMPVGATWITALRGGAHLFMMTPEQAAIYDSDYPTINEGDADMEIPPHESPAGE